MTEKRMGQDEFAATVTLLCGVPIDGSVLRDTQQTTFEELGVDSLGVMGVVAELEKRGGIKLGDAAETMPTPQALLDYYHEALPAEEDAGPPARTSNEITIDAPLDLVWDLTNDLTRWTRLFSEYAGVKVLEDDGKRYLFRLTMHPDDQGRVWSWVSERILDREALTVRARRVEPGPFEFMNLVWTYTETDEGVRMLWEQEFRMRPDAPVSTGQMADRINANSPVQMKLIKDRVERYAADPGKDAL